MFNISTTHKLHPKSVLNNHHEGSQHIHTLSYEICISIEHQNKSMCTSKEYCHIKAYSFQMSGSKDTEHTDSHLIHTALLLSVPQKHSYSSKTWNWQTASDYTCNCTEKSNGY